MHCHFSHNFLWLPIFGTCCCWWSVFFCIFRIFLGWLTSNSIVFHYFINLSIKCESDKFSSYVRITYDVFFLSRHYIAELSIYNFEHHIVCFMLLQMMKAWTLMEPYYLWCTDFVPLIWTSFKTFLTFEDFLTSFQCLAIN